MSKNREQELIRTTAILTIGLRDAEEREGVPLADRVKASAIAEHISELYEIARKLQRANLDLHNDAERALTAPKRRDKLIARVRDHAAFFGVRIAVTDDPSAFPLMLSGDRIGRATNSFAGEGWGIAP